MTANMIFSCELTFFDLIFNIVKSHIVKENVLIIGHPDKVVVGPVQQIGIIVVLPSIYLEFANWLSDPFDFYLRICLFFLLLVLLKSVFTNWRVFQERLFKFGVVG